MNINVVVGRVPQKGEIWAAKPGNSYHTSDVEVLAVRNGHVLFWMNGHGEEEIGLIDFNRFYHRATVTA